MLEEGDADASPSNIFCFTLKRKNIMAKGKQVKVKATARRKPKLSSGKGGFLVGRVSTIIKNKKSKNG